MPDGIVIIGAGLAGLSAAYHIGKGCAVFEASGVPGGLSGTREVGGFLFDYTGHLLHLKDKYVRGLVKGLLKGNLKEHTRNAAIYSNGTYTKYPFQANTYGLPEDVRRECVDGFAEAAGRVAGIDASEDFGGWIRHYFGRGIARHFMLPYNRKLWQYPLEEMTADGIAPYVPIPSVGDIRRGSTEEGALGLGYNAKFYYPERGGISSLVAALLPHVKDMSLGQRALEIDAEKKTVLFGTGYTEWYESLVSTMPLPELIGMIKDVPREIADAAKALRYVSVCNINIGVAGEGVSPYHWAYFPEPDFVFYRAGVLTNFSAAMAPKGHSAIYAEVSHRPGDSMAEGGLLERAIDGLARCGMLMPDDEVPVTDVQDIKYAYVVFDSHRARALPAIMEWLSGKGIMSIGRYGAWEYSSMEDAIIEGRDAALRLA